MNEKIMGGVLTKETYLASEAKIMEQMIRKMLDRIYPVGIIIEFDRGVDPNKSIGGTWERCLKGKVSVGVDENDADFTKAGNTGGAKTHTHDTKDFTLTENELPNRTVRSTANTDRVNINNTGNIGGWGLTPTTNSKGASTLYVRGGGNPHNHGETETSHNLMPYETVFKWKRTA